MITEAQINEVLAHPLDRKWTLQGFGMLRTYLDPDEVHRLHIWDVNTAVPEVSVIHDHPWDFDSRIIMGSVVNQRYSLNRESGYSHDGAARVGRIKTGEGGGLDPKSVITRHLFAARPETYGPGETYHMDAPELHESLPSPGAVTLISRKFHTARDDQFATVCWHSEEWVSAEPRPATRAEVEHFAALALGGVG